MVNKFPHLRLGKPITVSIPKKEPTITLSREDLIYFRDIEILPLDAYILFAIKASYSHEKPSIHVSSFCEFWDLQKEEFLKFAKHLEGKIELDLVPQPQPWDAVLGGGELGSEEPQPWDAVLGGQDGQDKEDSR